MLFLVCFSAISFREGNENHDHIPLRDAKVQIDLEESANYEVTRTKAENLGYNNLMRARARRPTPQRISTLLLPRTDESCDDNTEKFIRSGEEYERDCE